MPPQKCTHFNPLPNVQCPTFNVQTWKDCIVNDKTIWHRIIANKLIHESNTASWKHVLEKIPFEILKEIGEGVLEFLSDIKQARFSYSSKRLTGRVCGLYTPPIPSNLLHSPLHTTAGLGLLKSSKYIINKTNDYTPANDFKSTPIKPINHHTVGKMATFWLIKYYLAQK